METFETSTLLARPIADIFEFLCIPSNLIEVSPPKLHMQLVEAPPRLHLGAVLVVQGRRWGLTQRVVSEVTSFEPHRLLVDEQRQGPFRRWVHAHHLESAPEGTRMVDRIEFETPSGLLGLVMTPGVIRRELEETFVYREQRFRELLVERASPATQ